MLHSPFLSWRSDRQLLRGALGSETRNGEPSLLAKWNRSGVIEEDVVARIDDRSGGKESAQEMKRSENWIFF
jgi:hypothetical protein